MRSAGEGFRGDFFFLVYGVVRFEGRVYSETVTKDGL